MLEKVMQQIQNIIKSGAQKEATNHKKTYQQLIRKKDRKTKGFGGGSTIPAWPDRIPVTPIIYIYIIYLYIYIFIYLFIYL